MIKLDQNICIDRHLDFSLDHTRYGKHSTVQTALQDRYNTRVEIGYGISEIVARLKPFLSSITIPPSTWLGAHDLNLPEGDDALYIVNPNGWNGSILSADDIRALSFSYRWVIVDEAYGDFADQSIIDDIPDNTIVLKTLSKSIAMPGARLGWAMGCTEILDYLRLHQPRNRVVGGLDDIIIDVIAEIPLHVQRMYETKRYIESNYQCFVSCANNVLFRDDPKFNNIIMADNRMALCDIETFHEHK